MRGEKYPLIVSMVEKYEYKFKKPMSYEILLLYVSEAYNISRKTAKEYADDLFKMNYLFLDRNAKIQRLI